MLPIRYLPITDESLPGYALRLAKNNAWRDINSMLKDSSKRPIQILIKSDQKLLAALTELSGHGEAEFKYNQSSWVELVFGYDSNRIFRNMISETPKVCPDCIEDNGFIRIEWRYMGYDWCETHRKTLINKCEKCNAALTWSASILENKCPSCCACLAAQNTSNQKPEYLIFLQSLDSSDAQQALSDLLIAAQRLMRPLDAIYEHLEYPPKSLNFVEYLNQAYVLLTSERKFKDWASKVKRKRREVESLGQIAVLLPVLELIQRLEAQWPITRKVPRIIDSLSQAPECNTLAEVSNFPFRRSRTHHFNDASELNFHVEAFSLPDILGLPPTLTVHELIYRDIIKPINVHSTTRFAIIDLRTLVKNFSHIRKYCSNEATSGKYLCYDDYAQMLPLFGANELDVLDWIKARHVSSYITEGKDTFIESFLVKKSDLFRCLVLTLNNKTDENVRINELATLFAINEDCVQELVSKRILYPTSHQKFTKVTGDQILAFRKGYFNGHTYSRFHGLNKLEFIDYLEEKYSGPIKGIYKMSRQLRVDVMKYRLEKH